MRAGITNDVPVVGLVFDAIHSGQTDPPGAIVREVARTGLTEAEASSMIVTGFIEPLVKELPMEYAVEMNRLIQLQMEGSVG